MIWNSCTAEKTLLLIYKSMTAHPSNRASQLNLHVSNSMLENGLVDLSSSHRINKLHWWSVFYVFLIMQHSIAVEMHVLFYSIKDIKCSKWLFWNFRSFHQKIFRMLPKIMRVLMLSVKQSMDATLNLF